MFAFFTSFSFVMTGMLVALAGVSIPIIIHLLHRQRTQPIQWGAMQFLLESPLQQKRRKTVEHWLLMLLRMLLIALVVLMLSRMTSRNGRYNPLGSNTATDVGIVIDHSLSTGRHTGDRTVFERNIADLDGLTEPGVLRGNDTISIVLAEHEARRLTPLPISPGKLPDELSKLRKLKPGLSDASIPDAVQAARDLITRKGRNTRKVIIVVSDAQRTGWQIESINSWNAALGQRIKGIEPPVKMYELSNLPDPQAPNVSVGSVKVSPNLVSVGRPAQIDATVTNNGSKGFPAMTATLKVGGRQVTSQPVAALEAGQSRTLHFEHAFTDAGSNAVEVSIDANDSLAADNSAVVSVYAWQTLPVLIIDGKLSGSNATPTAGIATDPAAQIAAFNAFRNARFLQMAMLSDSATADAVSLIKPTIVGSLDSKIAAHLDDYAAVVVNDVPRLVPELQAKLADYVRSGHGVWFILGQRTDPVFIRDSLAQARLFQVDGDPQTRQNPNDESANIDIKDGKNVMLEKLTAPEHNVMTGVKTFKWWSIKPMDRDRKVLLAVANTGDPLVIDRPLGPNGGCVVVWTTPVDGGAWNNWPSEKLFAPLVNETLYHLAGGQIKGMENRRLESGDKIVWTGPAQPVVQKVEVTRPDGTKAERHPFTRDGRQVLIYGETDLPGKYELHFDQTAIQPVYYGVGISPAELDETALSQADRDWLSNPDHKYLEERIDAKSLGTALGNPNKGTELWPTLAGLVLASLLLETFLTYRMIRRQAAPAPDAVLAGSIPPVRIS